MTRYTPKLLTSAAALALVALVSGCSSSGSDDANDMTSGTDENVISFAITANGTSEVPATASGGSAAGTMTLDTDTGMLSGSVTTSGLTATMAHIHEGYAGTNGGVVLALDVTGDTLTIPDGSVLDSAQMAAMQSGAYYLNVHSDAFPSGEVRAQIAADTVQVIQLSLEGSQEVPAVNTAASGTAYVTVNTTDGDLVVNILTGDLSTPQAAHLHSGYAGENGGVIVGATQDSSDASVFAITGETLSADDLATLLAGGTYINVHTAEVPSGELRGQVLPSSIRVLTADLDGAQEVPPVTSAGSGTGAVTVDTVNNTVTARLSVSGVDDATMAHIHTGAAGENGGVLIGLTAGTEVGSWLIDNGEVLSTDVDAMLDGGTYFNVHTPAVPSGELRGQISE